ELGDKADSMANALATSQASDVTTLNRLREQHSVEEATLLTSRGRVIAQAGAEPVALLADLPSANVLRQLRTQQRVGQVEAMPDGGMYFRVLVPVNVLTIADDIRILQVLQRAPPAIVRDANLMTAGVNDY